MSPTQHSLSLASNDAFVNIPLSPTQPSFTTSSSSDGSYVKILPPHPYSRSHVSFSQNLSAPRPLPHRPSSFTHTEFHTTAAHHTPPIPQCPIADSPELSNSEHSEDADPFATAAARSPISSYGSDGFSAASAAERGELSPSRWNSYAREFDDLGISVGQVYLSKREPQPFNLKRAKPLPISLHSSPTSKTTADLNKPLPPLNAISPLTLPSPAIAWAEKPLPPLPHESKKSNQSSPRSADTLSDSPNWGTLPFRAPRTEHQRLAPAMSGYVPASFSVPVRCRRNIPDLKVKIPKGSAVKPVEVVHNSLSGLPRRPEAVYPGAWNGAEGCGCEQCCHHGEGHRFGLGDQGMREAEPVFMGKGFVQKGKERKSWIGGAAEWIEDFINGE